MADEDVKEAPPAVMDLRDTPKQQIQETLEVLIGPQMGSDRKTLAEGGIDVRRLSRISEIEAYVFPYFMEIPDHRGGGLARRVVQNKLNLNMSIDGWRANQLIRVIGASKGSPSTDMVKAPGWIGRNITKKKWREQAQSEGKEIVE